ncbi:uncharacterized protein LOC116547657 [Sapajus apella]|uniref:Uncharacterized protein LOC116547657 n=1 Tax=Sapajus apella TaxID=9515 RepID=A0A6J3HHH2_SAPAP|nr:uncharacterized protein LOC116547657 [Sapajus apella]
MMKYCFMKHSRVQSSACVCNDGNSENEAWNMEHTVGLWRVGPATHTCLAHRATFGCSFPEELYGDFEDLETGDVHKGKSGPITQNEDIEKEVKEEIDPNEE